MQKLLIETERLLIRDLRLSDLDDFHFYRSNEDIAKYQGFYVMDLKKAKEFIIEQKDRSFGEPGQWVQYGIENRSTQKLIGDCAIRLDENNIQVAEIGITISHLHQRNGFAKEAMRGIFSFLFNTQNVQRIVETVDVENLASIKLMESLGLQKEEHSLEKIFFKGKWSHEIQYSIVKSEWNSLISPSDSF